MICPLIDRINGGWAPGGSGCVGPSFRAPVDDLGRGLGIEGWPEGRSGGAPLSRGARRWGRWNRPGHLRGPGSPPALSRWGDLPLLAAAAAAGAEGGRAWATGAEGRVAGGRPAGGCPLTAPAESQGPGHARPGARAGRWGPWLAGWPPPGLDQGSASGGRPKLGGIYSSETCRGDIPSGIGADVVGRAGHRQPAGGAGARGPGHRPLAGRGTPGGGVPPPRTDRGCP